MPQQTPKATHPWRNWVGPSNMARVKKEEGEREEEKTKGLKSVKVFLGEIVESWETVEISTYCYGREGRYKLTELPQGKIAAWLSGMLRRNYYTE